MSIGDQSVQAPATAVDDAPSQAQPRKNRSRVAVRLFKLSILVGLPLLLLPVVFPRKVSAKRLTGSESTRGSGERATPAEETRIREQKIQALVDTLRTRLSIPEAVAVALVPENKLVVSVERLKGVEPSFRLALESSFVDGLSDDELGAVVAHELGHVWIFTHHPYLQTEELANHIAMRVVQRETLEQVYEKVWKRAGARGNLQYLPVD